MRRLGYLILALVLLGNFCGAASWQPPKDEPLPPIPPCADCPQPDRPWMRGTQEIQCARPENLAAAQEAHPTKNIVPCEMCKHRCNPFAEHADETDNREWDSACAARCSPKGCSCKNPCDS